MPAGMGTGDAIAVVVSPLRPLFPGCGSERYGPAVDFFVPDSSHRARTVRKAVTDTVGWTLPGVLFKDDVRPEYQAKTYFDSSSVAGRNRL